MRRSWTLQEQERVFSLEPPFRAEFLSAADDLNVACGSRGYHVRITEGLRARERQEQLWRQGRTQDPTTKHWLVIGTVVTWAPPGSSAHEVGLAADILLVDDVTKKPLGDAHAAWRDWAAICEAHGLVNLGTRKGDWCHVEQPNWQREVGRA